VACFKVPALNVSEKTEKNHKKKKKKLSKDGQPLTWNSSQKNLKFKAAVIIYIFSVTLQRKVTHPFTQSLTYLLPLD
jgi:hypothetical protein